MGAWFSSEADDTNGTNISRTNNSAKNVGAAAPRVNNSAKNVEAGNVANGRMNNSAKNVEAVEANGAAAPRVNNSIKNVEAVNAVNGAAAPRVNNTTRNAEKGNRRNNSRKNNAASAPKLNEPSPVGQEEEGFAPNTVVNVKNQAGGRKRKSKGSRKGKGCKGKSRKNRN